MFPQEQCVLKPTHIADQPANNQTRRQRRASVGAPRENPMKNLLLLSIILLAGTGGAFGDSILISPASQNVSVGQTFTLDINIDQIPDLFDYQFSLSFNAQCWQPKRHRGSAVRKHG